MLSFRIILVIATTCYSYSSALKIILLDKAGTQKEAPRNASRILIHGDEFTDLSCIGQGPLEWLYEGSGRPSRVKELARRRLDGKVSSTLQFAISADSTEYVYHSGRYVCRLLRRPEVNSSVYVHFKGDGATSFMDGSSTSGILYLPYSNTTSTFVVPCVSTVPQTAPKLLRVLQNNMTTVNASYDPLVGFRMNVPGDVDSVDMAGEYACSLGALSENATMRYFVYPPKSVKASPADSIVYVGKKLNLTCEYTEPVVIKETESNLPLYDDEEDLSLEEEIEETTETIPTSVHVANYIDTEPVPGSFGEFQCVTDSAEKRVLHTWRYFVIGKEADELSGIKYNKKKQEFRCRSKVNQPGLLSFIHCATPSECRINRICLEKSDSCRGYKAPLKKPNHCKSSNGAPCTKIVYNGGSGYVRCVAEGIDQIRGFGARGALKRTEGPLEFPRKLNLTLNDVTMESNMLIFNVTLKRSSYHFIEGNRWSYVHQSGSSEVVTNVTARENKVTREVANVAIRIPVDSTRPVKIICHVPHRDTMGWETVSVHIQESDLPDFSVVEDPQRLNDDNELGTTTEPATTNQPSEESDEDLNFPTTTTASLT